MEYRLRKDFRISEDLDPDQDDVEGVDDDDQDHDLHLDRDDDNDDIHLEP